MDELQQVIKGSLFINAMLADFDDTGHEHVVLAKKVAESVLLGTLDKYEKQHGTEALESFLHTLPEVVVESDISSEG